MVLMWQGNVLESEFVCSVCRSKDQEYGVSRGIDFQNVANIINFDFLPTA